MDTYTVEDYGNGHLKFYQNSLLQKEIGNNIELHYKDGILHREEKPAVILPDGTQFYYFNGMEHNLDGPAITYANNRRPRFFINGKELDVEEFRKIQEMILYAYNEFFFMLHCSLLLHHKCPPMKYHKFRFLNNKANLKGIIKSCG